MPPLATCMHGVFDNCISNFITDATIILHQTVRQARLRRDSDAFRAPPKNWKRALTRLAENRVAYYRRLTDKLKP